MKKWTLTVGIGLALIAGFLWNHWKQDEPRRSSLTALSRLHQALQSNKGNELRELLPLPSAIRNRTAAVQTEFIRKALSDELSAEGLEALRRHAEFGSLMVIFPSEARS